MAGNSKSAHRTVTSKIAVILRVFTDERGHTVTDVAREAGLPLSTAHRLMNELLFWGVFSRSDDGLFHIALPLHAFRHEGAALDLREWAGPAMEDLARAADAPVRFGVLDHAQKVTYIEKQPGAQPVTMFSLAATLPAHATALGKVLLAFSSEGIVRQHMMRELQCYTTATVTSRERLDGELGWIRWHRLSVSHGELEPGSSAMAVPVIVPSVPVVAALEVRVPSAPSSFEGLQALLTLTVGGLLRDFRHARLNTPSARSVTALPSPSG